jgi:hypothetical protein
VKGIKIRKAMENLYSLSISSCAIRSKCRTKTASNYFRYSLHLRSISRGWLLEHFCIFTSVKVFAFILALHAFFLSASPCEGFACKDELRTEQSQDEENEICSPFCICATCAGFTFNPTFSIDMDEPVAVEFRDDQYPEYNNGFHSQFILNIWQPPQVG